MAQSGALNGIGLFDLAERRLQWLGARQGVLSQNLANADTPGYVPSDLKPFNQALSLALRPPDADPLAPSTDGAIPVAAGGLEQTSGAHLPGLITHDQGIALLRGEKAPDGNQVSVDRELEKVAETDTQHEAVTAIYMKYMGMFRTALGK